MKFIRLFVFAVFFAPFASFAAPSEFVVAAQLLAAAKNADIQQVQILVNNGANVNYVDNTGLSLVCTAMMNNDLRAAQILQMYGADASQCDKQIKDYKTKNSPERTGGLFGGLSTAQGLTLAAAGAAVVVGGLFLLTDVFDPDNGNDDTGGGSSSGGGSNSGGSSSSDGTAVFSSGLPYGPAMPNASMESSGYTDAFGVFYNQYITGADETQVENTPNYENFVLMNENQNYLLLMRGYSPLARGYLGMRTLRNLETNAPLSTSQYNLGGDPVEGGRPVNVALITANGINAADDTSLQEKFLIWTTNSGPSSLNNASNTMISSKYYNNTITYGSDTSSVSDDTVTEEAAFDLSGAGTAIHNTDATEWDDLLAKIVGGNMATAPNGDFVGFMPNGQMTIYRTGGGVDSAGNSIDYYNYTALVDAGMLSYAGDLSGGRSAVDVIANADVIEPLHEVGAGTISDILEAGASNYKAKFLNLIGESYGTANTTSPTTTNATSFFNNLGARYSPLTIFSTGGFKTDSDWSDAPLDATFENAAPLVYGNGNLEHLFMSVVAVGASTAGVTSITPNSDVNSNKYQLAQWAVGDGTDATYYKSRVCGVAGKGGDGIDPWCFAAVGVTDEMAVAAAAGAAGVLRSAFYYMTPQQIFMLLALTADGPFLNRLTSGTQLNETTLVTHLTDMYIMPESYQWRIDNGEDYLDVFKEVFGYGVINLERATTPGTNLYFYDGNSIASTSGNAYWRAAVNTGFRSSAALNLGRGAIDVAAYDMLESIDGSMWLPRVWKNSIAFGNDAGRRGLYMGDVLGDLRVRTARPDAVRFGNMSFGLARSERAYNDNMGGLDFMRLEYANENWKLGADYQRYLTNGESRFTGMANPILALASNAVTGDAHYNYGNWAFGARAFSGVITDEGLLANDPTISSNYEPMHLGAISGAQSELGWGNNRFGINTAFGAMHENNTVMGSYGSGLMAIGASNTNYVDIDAYFVPWETVKLRARATFAHTTPNTESGMLVQMSDFDSNAFAVSTDIGNFSFGASVPLAATNGDISYAYADYDIIDAGDGQYDLAVSNMGVRHIDMSPRSRELRFNASYHHNFGPFTDGAIGFIYRINPNNIDEYGNESIFMMKLSHAVGI
ncbi:MAG: hypothetical protein IJQ90_04745 [Alphaproteobacteria bacterium]|nr:hypothetical protein [Alphaproteobacteria bacterium]